MSVLDALVAALTEQRVEVVDLTAPLSADTGKYGLTQLQNLALLPPTGAVVVVAPLRIVHGSGSPARVLALVER